MLLAVCGVLGASAGTCVKTLVECVFIGVQQACGLCWLVEAGLHVLRMDLTEGAAEVRLMHPLQLMVALQVLH